MHWENPHQFVRQSKSISSNLIPSEIILSSVIEQVHNRKLTTFSLNQLNRIFVDTEAEVYPRDLLCLL